MQDGQTISPKHSWTISVLQKIISLCCHRLYKGHPNNLSWTLLKNIRLKNFQIHPSVGGISLYLLSFVCKMSKQFVQQAYSKCRSILILIRRKWRFVWTRSVKNKTFKSIILKLHVELLHSNERRFKCYNCEKNFKTSHALKDHKVCVHNKARDFVCEICSVSFILKVFI